MVQIFLNNTWMSIDPSNIKKTANKYIYNNIMLSKRHRFRFNCKVCGNETEKGLNLRALDFVCRNCKCKATSISKYGTDSPNQSEIVKSKKDWSYLQTEEFKEKSNLTKIKKYGDKNYNNSDKRAKTNIMKYGVGNISQSDQIKKKIKKRNVETYGVENVSQIDFVKAKKQNTCIEKYGETSYCKTNECKAKIRKSKAKLNQSGINEKRKQTCVDRYKVDNVNKLKAVKQNQANTTLAQRYSQVISRVSDYVLPLFSESEYTNIHYSNKYLWECKTCGSHFEDDLYAGKIPRCPVCNITASNLEKELIDWIKSLGVNIIEHDRSILFPKELDIYIPSHNLAIEFNGLYWHSELHGKDRLYHLQKTLMCQEKGIQLLHIFEDEWIEKKEIVKSIIKSKLNLFNVSIGSRKCSIKKICSKEASDFYNQNHIQGGIKSSINIGLFYQCNLVACLSFAKPRYNKRYDWEIIRFANLLNTKVFGSFSKLFTYFLSNYSGSIITYSDKRLFSGNIYKQNAFVELCPSKPSYWYFKNQIRFNRIRFQKHKLPSLLESYNPALTEWENMKLNGWNRIWDCGNYVFELIRQ